MLKDPWVGGALERDRRPRVAIGVDAGHKQVIGIVIPLAVKGQPFSSARPRGPRVAGVLDRRSGRRVIGCQPDAFAPPGRHDVDFGLRRRVGRLAFLVMGKGKPTPVWRVCWVVVESGPAGTLQRQGGSSRRGHDIDITRAIHRPRVVRGLATHECDPFSVGGPRGHLFVDAGIARALKLGHALACNVQDDDVPLHGRDGQSRPVRRPGHVRPIELRDAHRRAVQAVYHDRAVPATGHSSNAVALLGHRVASDATKSLTQCPKLLRRAKAIFIRHKDATVPAPG